MNRVCKRTKFHERTRCRRDARAQVTLVDIVGARPVGPLGVRGHRAVAPVSVHNVVQPRLGHSDTEGVPRTTRQDVDSVNRPGR